MCGIIPPGPDWLVFLPATRAFLAGENPYLVGQGFGKVYEPFWTFLLLAPFALLPFWTGRVLLFFVSLVAFLVTAVRMGAGRWQVLLFLCSAPVIGCINNGNVDWLVLLGLWMPPSLGLFFVLMKPQVGIGIAVFWLYQDWARGGPKQVTRTFLPVTLAYLISFGLYGFWLLQFIGMPANPERMSTFPWLAPIGLFLMVRALTDRDRRLSLLVGPLVTPYISQFSYAAPLLGLVRRPRLFLLAWIAFWLPVLARLWV